jgi:DNA polymerase-3 subunit delta'
VVSGFEDVIGHTPVLALLKGESESPTHAYLLVGPASVGKATVARRFAALLLCPDGSESCRRRVVSGVHPDLVLVEPDGRTALTVDQARFTVARASLAPLEAARKVFLFEEAGLMNDEAANALLKTLEEPSPTTVFLLVAESEDDFPATVASRCRTVVLGRVSDEEVAAALAARGVEPLQAERAAAASGGRPGLALMLATRPEVAAFRRSWLSVPTRLPTNPGEAFRLAQELAGVSEGLLPAAEERKRREEDGYESGGVILKEKQERERRRAAAALYVTGLEILASWYRDAAAAQFGAPVRNRDLPPAVLTTVTPAAAVAKAQRVMATVESLEANQRAELAFAALFADLAVSQ